MISKIVNWYRNRNRHETLKKLVAQFEKPVSIGDVDIQFPFFIVHPELISIGKGVTILANSRIQLYPELVEKEPRLSIGAGCFLGYRLCILGGADITIGENVLMASDVTIVSENHGIDPESELPYKKQKLTVAPIMIGNNCWIGDKVVILQGVHIGEGCVVGAGAIVTKSIPAYSIAVGNPARVIKRYNFSVHRWEEI